MMDRIASLDFLAASASPENFLGLYSIMSVA